MVSAEIQSWTDKTITAVSGTLVLSQESSRDVARHALKKLFALTNNELDASLKIIQEIHDFSVRRRLLEVFRQSFVEASEDFTSPLFFQSGDFSNARFAEDFDQDLLRLWRHSGSDRKRLNNIIKNYPNAARIRILKRLTSREFEKKRRIRYAVNRAFSQSAQTSSGFTTLILLIIFLAFLIIMFD